MEKNLLEIQYIEDYLLGKLGDKEKAEFERKVKTDEKFAKKVKQQALIMQRIKQIAIKKSIARVHNSYLKRERFSFHNVIKNPRYAFLTFLGVILIGYLVWEAETENRDTKQEHIETEQVEQYAPVEEIQKNSTDTLKINDSISEKIKKEVERAIYNKEK